MAGNTYRLRAKAAREAGYRLGSDRGSPNHGSTLACKRATAQIRPAALEAGAGSFEGTVGRFEGHLQHAGHLAGVEPKDVAQDEDGDLAWRQQLQGGHEGQRDGFGLLVAGLRPGRHGDGTLEEGVG